MEGTSQCRLGSAGQGCRGSEEVEMGHRPAETEGPVKKEEVTIQPEAPSNPLKAVLQRGPLGSPKPSHEE